MARILVSECKQEISSFNPAPSGYDDFVVTFGAALFARHEAGLQSEVAGALSVLRQRANLELVPGYGAQAITSGGTLAAAAYRRIADDFLAAVRAAGPVDAVYFALHGAMAAEGEPDPEGHLLEETRRMLGERVPIVASFDLHGIITERILRHCDAICIYHTYPHVDFFQTGERAARLLLRILDGARPTTARVVIPALVRGNELITATGLFGRMIRAAQAVEARPGGLSAGMFIGNPFTDVPELCSNVIVVTDDDPARAEREALAIATDFWSVHEQLQQPLVPLAEAARAALEVRDGTVVLVDAADATSSGAPGDSNAILRALRAVGYGGRVLAPLVDAPAVRAAMEAGVGGMLELAVGGSIDPRHEPLPLAGRVRLLSDGSFRNESDGGSWHGGPTAVVEAGAVTLVVTSRPVSLYDRSLFIAHGQDPAQFDLVVVKSPHCQPRFYADWAARLINVDAPGATSANLRSLGHMCCARPIFPLDEGVVFEPRARLFRR